MTSGGGPPPPRRHRGLEILALASFAVAQPLFGVLSRETTFFVAHGSRPADLVLFAGLVYLAPPLLLAAIVLGALRLGARLGSWLHRVVVALLTAMVLLPPLEAAGVAAAGALPLALGAGAGLAFALERSAGLRSFLLLLAPLTLAVPLLFLFGSPVARLVRPASVSTLDLEIGRPTPLVVLLLDELPLVSLMDADRAIDAELFPNFARLAASSHWFRNATAVALETDSAVPAILTGLYPDRRRPPIASEHPRSLFAVLGGRYDLEVVETQTRLCPRSLCGDGGAELPLAARLRRLVADAGLVYLHILLPRELTGRLPAVTATWADFAAGAPRQAAGGSLELAHIHADDRARLFADFLDRIVPGDRPALHFLHLMLPHIPWTYLPSGKEYWASLESSAFAEGVAPDSTWTTDSWLVAQGQQRHLLQVAFVDTLLGRLLDRLEETGLADRALLIVTSDHGLSFRPGQSGRQATPDNYADLMAVPLFVRTPGQGRGEVSDRNVELIDVLPTVAEQLAIELPFEIDGRSLFDDDAERDRKLLLAGPGRVLELPADGLDRVYASLDRKLRLFGGGLFAIGPHRELVGEPVSRLATAAAADVEVRLDQPEQYRDVEPASDYTPAHVFGRARWRGPPEQLDLAIAVNGVLRASTRTFSERGSQRFAALVPEESFVAGENAVEVFVVEPTPAGPALRPTARRAAPRYTLEMDGAGRVSALLSSDGSRCRLDPGAVDGAYLTEGTGHLGWALAETADLPYLVIMVFADGRLVHTTTTGSAPPASLPVAGRQELARAGFRFSLPGALLETTDRLRVFAVAGERGSELRPIDGGPDAG